MQRRHFFAPGSLARVFPNEPPAEPVESEYSLLRVRRRAMATSFEIAIPYGIPNALEAATAALDLIDDLEDQMTVYRDSSEISAINRDAANAPIPVEIRLFDLLTHAGHLTAETGGAFDIATGALTKAWGFYQREGRVPTPAERAEAMARTGYRHVILDERNRTIRFRKPGLELNLGSIGKGYALDRAAELLRTEWGISSALLHGGGSSLVAIGHPPKDPLGWTVALRHPWNPERTLGTVRLKNQGLGTSAATHQHFEHQGKRLGHVLDPRTGWPASGCASASVVGSTGAQADALSTACFVLGVEKALAFCTPRPHLAAILLPVGESAEPMALNLAPEQYGPPGFRDAMAALLEIEYDG